MNFIIWIETVLIYIFLISFIISTIVIIFSLIKFCVIEFNEKRNNENHVDGSGDCWGYCGRIFLCVVNYENLVKPHQLHFNPQLFHNFKNKKRNSSINPNPTSTKNSFNRITYTSNHFFKFYTIKIIKFKYQSGIL